MKRITLTWLLLFFFMTSFSQQTTVNAIIGDESFINVLGYKPSPESNELLRLQTHLYYVENLLRNKDVSHLSKKQQKNRKKVLDLLHVYWNQAAFPKNYDYEGRRPCFIDREGNICAVGYLIEKTAGRKMAEQINASHQYDYLLEMSEPAISQWADKHGLTLEECAMIQPAYGNYDQEVPVKPSYGAGSAALGGVNIGLTIMNLRGAGGKHATTLSCVGLITGTAQVILGATNIRKEERNHNSLIQYPGLSYKAQNTVSYLNIAAGTTTILTSAVNLLINRKLKDKRNAFQLYSYPGASNQLVAGLSFTRNL